MWKLTSWMWIGWSWPEWFAKVHSSMAPRATLASTRAGSYVLPLNVHIPLLCSMVKVRWTLTAAALSGVNARSDAGTVLVSATGVVTSKRMRSVAPASR